MAWDANPEISWDQRAVPLKIHGNTSDERRANRQDHFQKLLNVNNNSSHSNSSSKESSQTFTPEKVSDPLLISTESFTLEELNKALSKMKFKVQGGDELLAEFFKSGIVSWYLLIIFNLALETVLHQKSEQRVSVFPSPSKEI